jgi:hypothetical protein
MSEWPSPQVHSHRPFPTPNANRRPRRYATTTAVQDSDSVLHSSTEQSTLQRSNIMKKIFRVVAIAVFLLITSTVPSFADGNPIPICHNNVCTL